MLQSYLTDIHHALNEWPVNEPHSPQYWTVITWNAFEALENYLTINNNKNNNKNN